MKTGSRKCQKSLHSYSLYPERPFARNHRNRFVEATWKWHSFYLFWHFYLHQLKFSQVIISAETKNPLVPLNVLKTPNQNRTALITTVATCLWPQSWGPNSSFYGYPCYFLRSFALIWPIQGILQALPTGQMNSDHFYSKLDGFRMYWSTLQLYFGVNGVLGRCQ